MNTKIVHDEFGTHIDWELESVTASMVDWFWINMEKCMLLWHPSQHEPLVWAVPPVHGNPCGSIHIAPQTWGDGQRQDLYIRFENVSDVPEFVRQYVAYEHVAIVAGLGLGPQALNVKEPMGYRLHQWQKSDGGIIGRSSAIGNTKKESVEEGETWADHCMEEVGNWAVFLPQLHQLYRCVTNTKYNPFANLSVEGSGKDARYKFIGQ